MFSMRTGNRDRFGRVSTVWLVLFVSCESGKFVTDFDDSILVRFEKEANVAVVDDWHVLVLGGLFRGEMEMRVYPSLAMSAI